MRTGKELVRATKAFASEDRRRSWLSLWTTLAVIGVSVAVAVASPHWALRLLGSIVAGLTIVRGFILYHDFMHGAILVRSKLARAVFYVYGVLVMTPPRVWRQTHNYHHSHTCKVVGSHVGSFLLVTTEMWEDMTPRQRAFYRLARHPLTVFFAYLTVFVYGMCISPFLRRPQKHWDSALSLVLHIGIATCLAYFFGVEMMLFAFTLPLFVAFMMGGYLFYAQHNFEGVHIQERHVWEFDRAALQSSSYMKMGPVMNWFTGNIGYHHVHHLNPRIPFYRLPEAMAAIPELQNPSVTTLRPRDVAACFRLKVWDNEAQTMVGYPS